MTKEPPSEEERLLKVIRQVDEQHQSTLRQTVERCEFWIVIALVVNVLSVFLILSLLFGK